MPRDYGDLFERIQQEIDVRDINEENVSKFLKGGKSSRKDGLIKEFLINFSIRQGERFASERKINLNQYNKSNIYENWGRYHRRAIVIFSHGKIKAWKYI